MTRGVLRGLLGCTNGLPAVAETIDIAPFAGQLTIDVTKIQGVDVTGFNAIGAYFDNVATSGAGASTLKGLRVRPLGGAFLTTGYQRIWPAAATNDTMIVMAEANTPFTSWTYLANTNVPDMDAFHQSERNTWNTFFGPIDNTEQVIDAVQIVVESAGSGVTLLSGNVHLVGYR